MMIMMMSCIAERLTHQAQSPVLQFVVDLFNS